MKAIRRYALLIGYLVLVGFVVAGAFQVEAQRAEVELVSERRSHALCVAANELRQDIAAYLDELPPVPPPSREVQDPAVQEFLEALVERSERAQRADRFEVLECPPNPDDIFE